MGLTNPTGLNPCSKAQRGGGDSPKEQAELPTPARKEKQLQVRGWRQEKLHAPKIHMETEKTRSCPGPALSSPWGQGMEGTKSDRGGHRDLVQPPTHQCSGSRPCPQRTPQWDRGSELSTQGVTLLKEKLPRKPSYQLLM